MIAGLFLVACGSSALNQHTEQKYDALMERTNFRPVPSGQISGAETLVVAILFMCAGLFLLSLTHVVAAITAAINIFLYNVIYTGLKRLTPFAIIPGALVGAIPPLIGFTASGTTALSTQILLFSIFMFIWQLPHFLIISLRFEDEYRKAGFKMIFPLRGHFFNYFKTSAGFKKGFIVLNTISITVMLFFVFNSIF